MSRDLLCCSRTGLRLLMVCFVLTFVVIGQINAKNATSPSDSLFIHSLPTGTLPFNPNNAKWQIINGVLTAFSGSATGEINIWNYANGNWVANQTLALPGGAFSVFQLQDLDRDGTAELIAGTTDNGFLFVYHWANGTWISQNSDKYVWSTITGIAAGHFDDSGSAGILVQNQEGFLYLFKQKDRELDLIWKSPVAWRPFSAYYVADLDGDHRDEIIVCYQNGAIAILKMVNNSIVTVWENFAWGKILTMTPAIWDNKLQTKLVLSTTQKMIYILGYSEKGYQFETQLSQFPFIAENLAVPPGVGEKQILALDSAGKFHVLQYDSPTKRWSEAANLSIGRGAQLIIDPQAGKVWVWGVNQNGMLLKILHSRDIRLALQSEKKPLQPPLLYLNGRWYLAVRAVAGIDSFHIQSKNTNNCFQISVGDSALEISKKLPLSLKIDGTTAEKPDNCLIYNNEPYLSLELWQRFINFQLNLDADPAYLDIAGSETLQP